MKIELFEDNLTKDDVAHHTPRIGVRAILKRDDQYVIIYNENWNLYTLPGGGVDNNESLENALKREVLEETGYTITDLKKTVELTEYFYDSIWNHHFYTCCVSGDRAKPHLTKEEKEAGLQVVYKTLEEVLDIFLNHPSERHHSDAIYQREFLGFVHSV